MTTDECSRNWDYCNPTGDMRQFYKTVHTDGWAKQEHTFVGSLPERNLQVAVAEPRLACEPLAAPVGHTGAIVVERGDCDIIVKVKHAKDAGASAVIIVNDDEDMPESLGAGSATDADLEIVSNMTVVQVARKAGLDLISTVIIDTDAMVTFNCERTSEYECPPSPLLPPTHKHTCDSIYQAEQWGYRTGECPGPTFYAPLLAPQASI